MRIMIDRIADYARLSKEALAKYVQFACEPHCSNQRHTTIDLSLNTSISCLCSALRPAIAV